MRFKNSLLLLLLSFCIGSTYAQDLAKANQEENCSAGWDNGWCWGADPDAAKEKNVIYTDALKAKNYTDAVVALEWLLEKTPNLNKAIYINGEKIYRALEKEAQGEEKIALQDKILALYDTRIKYFGGKESITQKKGQRLYGFMMKREGAKEHYQEYLTFYEELHTLCGNKTKRVNLIYNMDLVYRLAKGKKLTTEEIIPKYEKIIETVDYNIEKADAGKKEKWESAKKKIDAKFEVIVPIDCDFVRNRWGENIKTNADNIKLSKKAIRYMLKEKCTDDPLFYTAVENVHTVEPSIQTANILAKRYLKLENYAKAKVFINQVIELAEDSPEDQADAYISLAKLSRKDGKNSEARDFYMKAAEKDVKKASSAYTAIGNMYMGSRNSCLAKSDPNPVKDRAVFFAAYAMFQKAGNNSAMARAAAQFPSMSEIFQYNYKVGDVVKVECWVGGSYGIKKRP